MIKLSDRQNDVYNAIVNLYQQKGRMPTMDEIAKEVGFKSTNNVYSHMASLYEKGWLEKKGKIFSIVPRGSCPFCHIPFTKIATNPYCQRARVVLLKVKRDKEEEMTLGPVEMVTPEGDWSDPCSLINLLIKDGWQVIRKPEMI